MNFPVFSQQARKLGFRDEFAPDCLLRRRVCELLVSLSGGAPAAACPEAIQLAVPRLVTGGF